MVAVLGTTALGWRSVSKSGWEGECGRKGGRRSSETVIAHAAAATTTSCVKMFPLSPRFATSRPSSWAACESRGGRPGLSILMSLTVSVDGKATLNRA